MQISLTLPANGLTDEQAKAMLGEVIQDEVQQAEARITYFAALCRTLIITDRHIRVRYGRTS